MTAQATALTILQDGRDVAARTDTLVYWLAQVAKQLREQAGRKQVHIAAAMSIDQSTIYRFEQGERWPRQADLIVAAYAEDLGIEDPRDIWQQAVDAWRERGDAPTVTQLLDAAVPPLDPALEPPDGDAGSDARAPTPPQSRAPAPPPRRRGRRRT